MDGGCRTNQTRADCAIGRLAALAISGRSERPRAAGGAPLARPQRAPATRPRRRPDPRERRRQTNPPLHCSSPIHPSSLPRCRWAFRSWTGRPRREGGDRRGQSPSPSERTVRLTPQSRVGRRPGPARHRARARLVEQRDATRVLAEVSLLDDLAPTARTQRTVWFWPLVRHARAVPRPREGSHKPSPLRSRKRCADLALPTRRGSSRTDRGSRRPVRR
jgi:hypothetical protein